MAVPELTAEPALVELRLALADARAAGVGFCEAWNAACGTVLLSEPTAWARGQLARVLGDTREHWERAYLGLPSNRVERAVMELDGWAADGEADALSYELA